MEWLKVITEYAVVIIDIMALIVIVIGTAEAFFNGLRVMLSSSTGHEKRDVWLRYARWLVIGLTFQLGADVIETAVAPGWDEIGRLGVIAVIRTFLNYFLERPGRNPRAGAEPRNHERMSLSWPANKSLWVAADQTRTSRHG